MRDAVVRRVLGVPDFRNAQDVYFYGSIVIDFEKNRVGTIYSSSGNRFCTPGGVCVGQARAKGRLRREGVPTTLLVDFTGGPFLHACRKVSGRAVSFQITVQLRQRDRVDGFLVRDDGSRCPTRAELTAPPA